MIDDKEVAYRVRLLKRMKKGTGVGTEERRDINRQIKEQKDKVCSTSETKEKLIADILKIRPSNPRKNLLKFTEAELQIHLNKITKR